MLEITGLAKRYGDVLALDGCSLQVPARHLVGLLGPNGAVRPRCSDTSLRQASHQFAPGDGSRR